MNPNDWPWYRYGKKGKAHSPRTRIWLWCGRRVPRTVPHDASYTDRCRTCEHAIRVAQQ